MSRRARLIGVLAAATVAAAVAAPPSAGAHASLVGASPDANRVAPHAPGSWR